MIPRKALALGAVLVAVSIGTASAQEPQPNDLLLATLWTQRSVEFKGNALTVYALAKIRLDQALADKNWTAAPVEQKGDYQNLPPAIVLDVDETVLDNSDYQKKLAVTGERFKDATWNAWIEERRATPLPGAEGFITTVLDGLHGQVILVTNRKQSQCAATEDNLRTVHVRYDRILCDRAGNGDKNPRFSAVIEGEPGVTPALNILIWVGDNIQDFPSLNQKATGDFADFGSHYFALPNPLYGSWQGVPPR